jgi:hypothetical protein
MVAPGINIVDQRTPARAWRIDQILVDRYGSHRADAKPRWQIPAKAPAVSAWVWPVSLSIRHDDLCLRAWGDTDEIHRATHPATLGVSHCAKRQCTAFGIVHPGARQLNRLDPLPLDGSGPVSGRRVPVAAIYQHQRMAYADIPADRLSSATSFNAVLQQLSGSVGISVAAFGLQAAQSIYGGGEIIAAHFPMVFALSATLSLLSAVWFARLDRRSGESLLA